MSKYSTKEIMDRIKGMYPVRKEFMLIIKKEPVLVVEDDTRYWAILDKGVLTAPDKKINAMDVIKSGGTIYFIGGPISTEEQEGNVCKIIL